jgi:transitional endoplasmic reticulum ATPase
MAENRSTLRSLERVAEIESGREVAVCVGNTSDVYIGDDGAMYQMPYLLAHDGAERGMATIVYSRARGAWQLNPGSQMPAVALTYPGPDVDAADALGDLFGRLPMIEQPCRVLIDYADLMLPAGTGGSSGVPDQERCIELLAEQSVSQSAGRSIHRLLILSRTGGFLDERLGRLPGFQIVTWPLPDRRERAAMIERAMDPTRGTPLRIADDLSPESFAELTGGLVNDDIVRGRTHVQVTGQRLERAWIQERKTDTLHRLAGDALVVYPRGPGMADVAGLPQVRRLIQEARKVGRPPRRILLAGPPGVGKTLVVRAIADELGYPCVALGNYRTMYVGETERRFRLVLQVIQDLAPCVLHIDEIDQSVGRRTTGQSSDGGTSERVLADMWEFLGDNHLAERVVVVGTTNRPELLDSAMLDRFTIIPVLHPTPPESADILAIAARREGHAIDVAQAQDAVERYGRLVTGRVLVDVMDRAMTLADMEGEALGGTHLKAAFDDMIFALDPNEHEHLALQAIALAKFASFLPWVAAQYLGETPHIPSYVEGLLDPSGQLDLAVLRQRLAT